MEVYYKLLLFCSIAAKVNGNKLLYKQDVISPKIADGVDQIKQYILQGSGKHATYNKLAELSDLFGSRMSGSQGLENATDYAVKQLTSEGFVVHTENVEVSRWIRGVESAELILENGRHVSMKILGLGTSIGTPPNGMIAPMLVVKSFDELDAVKTKVPGTIVVFNVPWQGYDVSGQYRVQGASRASAYGAVGVLIHSATPFSIDSPHTGMQSYTAGIKPIPAACITVEDSEMLQRWQDRGKQLSIYLYMDDKTVGNFVQRNIVAELPGVKYPNQTVIFGGHFDSWDVGTGSMDDGGGAMIAWQALSTIKALGLTAQRTLRLVLWTAEEQGLVGSQAYFARHKAEVPTTSFVLESDMGAFKPMGVKFSGSNEAVQVMRQILSRVKELNMTSMQLGVGGSSDTDQWVNAGVPGAELLSHNENYFDFHHSAGDRMTVLNADDMDLCTILWSVLVYSVADLDQMLPRNTTTSTTRSHQQNVHWNTFNHL